MDFKFLVVFTILIAASQCSRILVVYPTISKSHIMPLQSLSVALAEKGHEITFVSPYPLGKQVENYRDIEIPLDEADKEFMNEVMKDPVGKGKLYVIPRLMSFIFRFGNDTLQMKEMRKLMDEEKFDLVIVGFFMTDFMLGLADHFKCPSILFSPAGPWTKILQAIGNPLGTSGTPHKMANIDKMNFQGRLKNFLMQMVDYLMLTYTTYRAREVYK